MPQLNHIDAGELTSSKLDNSVQTTNVSVQSVPSPLKKLFPAQVIDKNCHMLATGNTIVPSAPHFPNVDANAFIPQQGQVQCNETIKLSQS